MNVTRRLAGISARHPWRVVGVWFILLALGVFFALGIGDVLTTEGDVAKTLESDTAADLAAQVRFANQPPQLAPVPADEPRVGPVRSPETVVVRNESLTVRDPEFRVFVESLVGQIKALPGYVDSQNYYETGNEGIVSADGHTTLIDTLLGGSGDDSDIVEPLVGLAHDLNGSDGFEVYSAGVGSIDLAFNHVAEKDLQKAEIVGLPIALLVLVLVFGAAVAAGVPIVLAFAAIIVAVGGTAIVGKAFELSFFVVNMIFLIGLAVGIDYSLLIVERFREERRRGVAKVSAIEKAGATASRAVMFSGMAVIVALAGLLLVPDTIFRSLSVGAILVTVAAISAGLTLLPAVLSLLGDKVNWLSLPFVRHRNVEDFDSGFWATASRAVMRRPWLGAGAAVALLVALAIPYFSIKLGFAGVSTLPRSVESFRGFLIIDEEFSRGVFDPVDIVIRADDVTAADVQAGIDKLIETLGADPEFVGEGITSARTDTLFHILVPLVGDPQTDISRDSIDRLRHDYIPVAFDDVEGAEVFVGGPTAETADYVGLIDDYTPVVFAFVLGLSFIVLLVVFRSLVVPAKAIVMNLLSVGAAYGLLVLVFQKGVAREFFGFHSAEQIDAWVPLFLFAVLFGLSMDYHVFLLSRIRERYLETRDNAGSVAYGVRSTANLITGAAAIMVAVFTGFAAGDLVMFQEMGFGLGVAVILDATVVRSVLVPSTMALLGDFNWYLPGWLHWLPEVRIEHEEPVREAAAT